ncbi:MAG: glycosyltransferase [Candidatus Acidiferrales bacterium]
MITAPPSDAMTAPSRPSVDAARRLKVLVLSKNYPNPVLEVMGLWAEAMVRSSQKFCEPKVISPVQYCPPVPGLPEYYTRLRTIPRKRWLNGIEVFHPRFITGPGYSLYSIESAAYYMAVRSLVQRLRQEFPFDLIHAHFTYPDGVVAVRLAKRFRVPVIITEQNPWGPWMDQNAIVRRQSVWAARECTFQTALSTAARDSIARLAGESEKLRVIPNVVDESVFTLPSNERRSNPNQIVFVGAIRPVKGVDVLLRSLRLLADSGRDVRLVIIGESFFKAYQNEYTRLQQMAKDLGLNDRVQFVGKRQPPELARIIPESALLVLPSRAESFGTVLVEALACGTPVVATRCGGPEDIVADGMGVLVPPEDPRALARGIAEVLDHRTAYDPHRLRAYAVEKFGLDSVGQRLARLYQEALDRSPYGSLEA